MKDFTEASLTVLFLLKNAGTPLTIEQITEALVSASDYNYIDAAIARDGLLESKLIEKQIMPTGEFYVPTIGGRVVLSTLSREIRSSVRKHIINYCSKNLTQLRLQSQLDCEMLAVDDGSYTLVLRAFEKDGQFSEITLTALDSAEAATLADNWKKHADEVIASVYQILSRDE